MEIPNSKSFLTYIILITKTIRRYIFSLFEQFIPKWDNIQTEIIPSCLQEIQEIVEIQFQEKFELKNAIMVQK